MAFTATCLHCHRAKFRVPDRKRGTFARCPKCRQESLLVPDEGTASALVDYKLFEPESRRAKRDAPTEVEVEVVVEDETRPADAAPTQPDEAPVAVMPTDSPPSRRVVVDHDASPKPDGAVYVALATLAAFGLAMLATQLPYGRFVAVPLAAVGVVVAGSTLFGLEAQRWLGWAGVGLNAAALTLALLLPSWLGMSGWVPTADPEAGPKPVTAVGRDGSLPKAAAWVNAAQAVWEQGDVRVAVTGVEIAPLEPAAKSPERRRERGLRVGLKLTNVGVARAIDFDAWAGPPTTPPAVGPTLTTAAGVVLAPKPPPTTTKVAVFPGKSAECVLWFALPTGVEELRLDLPPTAFQGAEPVRFSIPSIMIGGLLPRKAP